MIELNDMQNKILDLMEDGRERTRVDIALRLKLITMKHWKASRGRARAPETLVTCLHSLATRGFLLAHGSHEGLHTYQINPRRKRPTEGPRRAARTKPKSTGSAQTSKAT